MITLLFTVVRLLANIIVTIVTMLMFTGNVNYYNNSCVTVTATGLHVNMSVTLEFISCLVLPLCT